MSHALMEKIIEQDALINTLAAQLTQKDRTIAGMKHYLKIAAEYQNDDLEKRLDGIQAALGKAASYEGRTRKTRRR